MLAADRGRRQLCGARGSVRFGATLVPPKPRHQVGGYERAAGATMFRRPCLLYHVVALGLTAAPIVALITGVVGWLVLRCLDVGLLISGGFVYRQ